MENTTAKTRDALLQDVDKLKSTAFKVADDVRHHATAQVDETKQRMTDTFKSVRDNLADRPLALLGIGFGVGLLLGWRLRR